MGAPPIRHGTISRVVLDKVGSSGGSDGVQGQVVPEPNFHLLAGRAPLVLGITKCVFIGPPRWAM